MKNVFEGEGDLRAVDPLAALVSCWRERSSGELRFERGASESGFDLDQGEVVGVLSTDPRFETAAILVRAGKLGADAVESLTPQGGDPALLALQTGLLTRREWKWGEKIRAIEVLSDVLSWEDGRYRFESQARPKGGEFRLAVPRLLLELFLRSRDQNLIDHQLGPPDQRLVRGERFDAEFASFGLTADAESVVHLIDGRSTAAEIAQKAPAEDFAVRKLLAALVTLGLVHPVPVAPARAFERSEVRETESTDAPEPFHAEPDRPEPDVPEPRPEETMAIEVPSLEIPAEREAPFETDLPETAAEESAPADLVELPGAEASPLDRFEPQRREPAPWEEPPAPAEPERWEGEAGFPGPIEPPEPAPEERRFGGGLAWVLGLLAAAVVGIVIWRSRTPAPAPAPTAAAVRPSAVPAVTFPPPVTAARLETSRPAAAPTAAPAAPTAPVAAAVRPTPASRMAAVRPTALAASRPTPAAARPAEPVSESRAEWVKRAERDRKKLETDRRAHYAVQLELVCEVDSLAEAWKHDKNQTMWLLTTNHAGRDCFRVLWGRYPTLEAAKKGKSAIPAYFVTARNRPAVVSVP
jgi:hypothetical protein